ncbi:hypothetical protein NNJEOMEG_01290 [Fundidesulfovibrio magnetotacticus]|uniref:Tox-PAAR-like domain-containing protein n=1 Tax=Fundidesulfovibrio magnetotacticus TaxID=2730080 RepID=A0A6V8LUW9_9BACT|nr:DUF4150 domain-containing protein [Fundidesulfovibrio magnetotacticus]GFK93457.1 hypothetical protein NNJEOMEG_01290 [Fundidesulfovibrio magnetotacticus]
MFATTNETGMAGAFPDVCLTPAPPAPDPVPIPYQNMAMMQNAKGSTCASKVFVKGAKAVTLKTEIAQSVGDEPGTAGGVASGRIQGPCRFTSGSLKVVIEGEAAVFQGSATKQNGDNPNTVGVVSNPSQTTVMYME